MTSLLQYDKGNPKIPRHKKPSISDDEFETPPELFCELLRKYDFKPILDAAATKENRKCLMYFSKEDNALEQDWKYATWVNHPHSLHEQFVQKAYQEWQKHNVTIMMIIPANCGRTTYWHKYIEGIAYYSMIKGSITFLKNGKPTKDSSRNAYCVVIWRSRK